MDMKTRLIIPALHNLSSCETKARKKFRPEGDSKP